MKRLLLLVLAATAIALAATAIADAPEPLPDAEIARAFINLGRMRAIVFGLKYRLATGGDLDIGTTPHARAVALQLRDDEVIDPWGTPYRIDIKGRDFLVIGAGADKEFHPEEWDVQGATFTLAADTVMGPDLPIRQNYTYVLGMIQKKINYPYGLYTPPGIASLDQRESKPLLIDPRDAFQYQQRWETAVVALRHGDLDVMKAARTLAAMQLLASRLETWRAAHGSLAALAGKDVLTAVRTEEWPFNDWLSAKDEWNTPLRIDIAADGRSYRIASAGSDRTFDTAGVQPPSTAVDQIIADGRVTQQFDLGLMPRKAKTRADFVGGATQAGAATEAHDGSMAYHVGGNVKPPVNIKRSEPKYPEALLKQKVGGLVIVETIVDENGRVASVKMRHSANPDLAAAVVEAVKQWEFQPATLNGKPVRSIFNVTIEMRPN
jgi:TonB family protein